MQSIAINLTLVVRNLSRQPRRSAIAIAAVSFGIVALMLANGFIEWIYFDMRESTIRAHLGHLQIVRPGYHASGKADPFGYLLPPDGPMQEALAREPGVKVIAPRLSFSGLASVGETTVSFIGDAVNPRREAEFGGALTIDKGTPLREGDDRGAVFGAGLAQSLGVGVGDQVVLLVTRASGGVNAVEVTVRGIFSTISKAYDDAALRMPIDTARSLLGASGAHAWVVLLDDTERTDAVAGSLRGRLPADQFQVVSWRELADFYNKTVALFSRQVQVIRVIIGAIIVLSISNTMMMSVIERTGEIGTSMALGAPRRRILGLFISEGALLGLVGGLIGVALGYALALAISAIGIPMPAPPGMAHGFTGQILITPRLTAESLALAIATALAASVYPALKASRLAVVDALRHNR